MVSDTEVPSAPLTWADSIHGDLVLVDRVQADGWLQADRGEPDPSEAPIVPDILSSISRGAGTSLRLVTPPGQSATTLEVHDGRIFVITDLNGPGDDALRSVPATMPEDAFVATGAPFTIGFVGLVLFDGTASWEMVSESMLYVFAEVPKGDYQIDVCAEHPVGDKKIRVFRLRPPT